jgi:hypothetical protein
VSPDNVSARLSTESIRARFTPRDVLPSETAIQQFWGNLPRKELLEVAELLEEQYGLPFGFFRPDDRLWWLLEPLKFTGLKWLWAEAALEDAATELSYRLSKKVGRVLIDGRTATIGDFLNAWCSRAA